MCELESMLSQGQGSNLSCIMYIACSTLPTDGGHPTLTQLRVKGLAWLLCLKGCTWGRGCHFPHDQSVTTSSFFRIIFKDF